MSYDNTDKGTLFRQDKNPGDNPNRPEYNGSMLVLCPHCEEKTNFWLAAWIKIAGPTAKKPGSKFFSLALTEKDPKPKPIEDGVDVDEDVPF